ncbi:MAG: glycerol-3-phosphate responsive antiterminator [Clostridia bacterium]|nr:glycerol-3-phosphate responsive antiterminator [Clostridia bacterium]
MSRLYFEENPIIAAVKSAEELNRALASDVETVFLLHATLSTLSRRMESAREAGKRLFIHMDLVEGLSKDAAGVEFLASLKPDGIISTRSGCIHAAREAGITCIQRFFMVDSRSVITALESIRQTRPDMIEILPGIAYKTITRMASETDIPVIAGGLIETKEEIYKALSAGAAAVSTGARDLWGV